MKNIRSFLFFIFLVTGFINLFALGSKEANGLNEKKLIVYTTKSFAGDYGPGQKIAELFKAETGVEVEYVVCKEGVLNRAIVEGKNSTADVLIGIDNHLVETARKANVLRPYLSKNAASLVKEVLITEDWLLTPFDYGYLAFMFDTDSKLNAPKTLNDLTKPEYKGKIVILDPRTSTTGLALVAWTRSVFADNYLSYWEKLRPNIFTMAPKWSAGYDLFTAGEAPFAFSYTGSLASHVLYDNTMRFQPLIFNDGHIIQIEGMGISSYAKNIKAAELFIDFMLTEKAQSLLPETQFMFPAINGIKLPDSYKDVPAPKKVLRIPSEDQSGYVNAVINVLQN